MRYRFLIASLLVAVAILVGLTFVSNAPVAAQGPRGVFEQQGTGTVCVNKGALVFEKISSVAQLEPFMKNCGENGSWVLTQPYNWDGDKNPELSIHGLTALEAKEMLLKAPQFWNSGSLWFESGKDPTGARVVTGQIVETNAKGSLCLGTGALTFESVKSRSQLDPFKCDKPGKYTAFQWWHSPSGHDKLLIRKDNLSWDELMELLKGPEEYNSGSITFKSVSDAQVATFTPTSVPASVATATATNTLVPSVPTATPTAQAAVPVATPTLTPTEQPRTQEREFPWLPVIGGCLILLALGLLGLVLFLRRRSSRTD